MVKEGYTVQAVHLNRVQFVVVNENAPMGLDGEGETARVDVVDDLLCHRWGKELGLVEAAICR